MYTLFVNNYFPWLFHDPILYRSIANRHCIGHSSRPSATVGERKPKVIASCPRLSAQWMYCFTSFVSTIYMDVLTANFSKASMLFFLQNWPGHHKFMLTLTATALKSVTRLQLTKTDAANCPNFGTLILQAKWIYKITSAGYTSHRPIEK